MTDKTVLPEHDVFERPIHGASEFDLVALRMQCVELVVKHYGPTPWSSVIHGADVLFTYVTTGVVPAAPGEA